MKSYASLGLIEFRIVNGSPSLYVRPVIVTVPDSGSPWQDAPELSASIPQDIAKCRDVALALTDTWAQAHGYTLVAVIDADGTLVSHPCAS